MTAGQQQQPRWGFKTSINPGVRPKLPQSGAVASTYRTTCSALQQRLEPWKARQFFMWMLLLGLLLAVWPARAAEPSFLESQDAFRLSTTTEQPGEISLSWDIAPGYYLYRDRIQVTGPGVKQVVKPAGEAKEDPTFGRVEVYHNRVTVRADAPGASTVLVTWQGCAEQGLCYPPEQRTVSLQKAASTAHEQTATPVAPAFLSAMLTGSDAAVGRMLGESSMQWSISVFFLLGVALAFTPCVLPMVPILSGIVIGAGATPSRGLALSLSFVAAMSLVYAALGVLAAAAGSGLQAALQTPAVVLSFSALFVVLALSMFGMYELQLPAFVRDRLSANGARGGSVGGAAAMGVLSALLVGPCMTAPLAGTLLYIAQTGEATQGAILLATLSLGMGLPLVMISTLGSRWLPRPGAWMNRVKAAFGFVMLGTAVWLAQRVLPAPAVLFAWGVLLTALALTLWHSSESPDGARTVARLLPRTGAAVAGLWGAAMVLGAAAGSADPMQPLAGLVPVAVASQQPAASTSFETITDPAVLEARLATAAAQGQPALVEFSADWCTSCKIIEREVFGDPRVPPALAGTLLLRADVTRSDPAQRSFMARHQVMGPPTLMLFDAQGRERREQRLVGEFGPGALLQRVVERSGTQ